MNTNALRDVLQRVLATAPVARIEAATDVARTPARMIGQRLQAQLVANLPNGRSLIDVEGVHVDVKLPLPARIGETLQLEVLALEPRLTFSLLSGATGPHADAVSMSDSFRRLSALLEGLTSETPAAKASPAAPILAAPPTDTAGFAERLKTLLTHSGLFYESHQAQWIAGERPLEDLMQEPQAALKPTTEPVHPQTVPLVQQQLEVLDTRQIVWSGEVWPHQSLEWRIEEESGHERTSDEAPASWKTSLRLTLPQLGEVTATLSIRGDEVRLAFSGLQSHAIGAVRSGQPALHDAFARAGLQLRDVAMPAAPNDHPFG